MKDYDKILDDICLCASRECPRHKECLRGIGYDNVKGVHTVSSLAGICRYSNYEYYIGDKDD